MKKIIFNLGKALNKAEQKNVNGGSKWLGHIFPSEGKCNFYCDTTCYQYGPTSPQGYTPHSCGAA